MLDINFIVENPEIVKENLRKRFQEEKIPLIDALVKKYKDFGQKKYKLQEIQHKRNSLTLEINRLKKQGKDIKKLVEEAKDLPSKIKETETEVDLLLGEIRGILLKIPNIIHESVPIGKDSKENKEIKRIGKPKKFDFEPKSHVELVENLGLADFEASARVAGNGFYYMIGDLALLNQALIRFGIDFITKKGFKYIESPLMTRKRIVEGVVDFEFFRNMEYKIEGEDLYLIATSEHPLVGMFIDQVIPANKIPLKLCSYSMCFRKEVGSHGIDEKGFYRTHQFNKVEMVVFCRPEESYKLYDEMLSISADIYKELGIPTRIFESCSGDLGDLKSKGADLEAWSPRKKEYFEVGSISNLTDAQSRRLNIKVSDGKNKYYPHTLNNTVIATSRAIVAIIENYQNKDGSITVPKVLVPYMNGKTKITKEK